MRLTVLIHITAGVVVVLAGYVALASTKGATVHRRAGLVFVGGMMITAMLGMVIAVLRGVAPAVNVPAALLTAYLIVTSFTTIRAAATAPWLERGALLVAVGVTLASFTFVGQGIAAGGMRKGIPAFVFLIFGLPALLAAVGDVRVIRFGALTGTPRLARHLWRMCYGLFIASISFYIGQADKLPAAFRIYPLLVSLTLLPLAAMVYWRLRIRRHLRGVVAPAAL